MVSKIKLIKKEKVLKELRKEYRVILKKDLEELMHAVERRLTSEYEGTFSGWKAEYTPLGDSRNFSTEQAAKYRAVFAARDALYSSLIVDIEITKRITKDLDIRMRIESRVNDASGKPNNLWYWLDQGVAPFTQKNRSPFLGTGGGYKKKGASNSGHAAREWSDRIGTVLKSYIEQEAAKIITLAGRVEVTYEVKKRYLRHHPASNKID